MSISLTLNAFAAEETSSPVRRRRVQQKDPRVQKICATPPQETFEPTKQIAGSPNYGSEGDGIDWLERARMHILSFFMPVDDEKKSD